MSKLKKMVSLILVFSFVLASNIFNVFASNSYTNISGESKLENLWIEGKNNIQSINIDGERVTTKFKVGEDNYELFEKIDSNKSVVNSYFYKIEDSKKLFLGEISTDIKLTELGYDVSIKEDGKEIFSDHVSIEENINTDLDNQANNNNYYGHQLYSCDREERWFYNGSTNGSNTIEQYTVGAVIVLLGAATGSPLATGLAYIAEKIVMEHWPRVYWTQKLWTFNFRDTCSPLYPSWISGGKYKYKTYFYSDSNRNELIGVTDYCDC